MRNIGASRKVGLCTETGCVTQSRSSANMFLIVENPIDPCTGKGELTPDAVSTSQSYFSNVKHRRNTGLRDDLVTFSRMRIRTTWVSACTHDLTYASYQTLWHSHLRHAWVYSKHDIVLNPKCHPFPGNRPMMLIIPIPKKSNCCLFVVSNSLKLV